ncbi:MAG: alpha-1,2-fucosyltransferase [Verrucomicrobiaceae bacterium]
MSTRPSAFVLRFSDGLGNQLFQYAFARMHTHQSGLPLLHDLSWYQSTSARDDRPFLMGHYRITGREWTPEEARVLPPSQRWLTGRLRHLAGLAPLLRGQHLYAESVSYLLKHCNSYHPKWMVNRGPGFASGYFTAHQYADSIRDLLLRELQPVTPYSEDTLKLAAQLRDEESVCVCFRRGDYAKLPQFGVLNERYYDSAFALLKARVTKPKFYLFSDNHAAAHATLAKHDPDKALWPNMDRPTPETLFLMSQCKHYILANSTFGWWAAWMGQQPDSTIIHPNKWFLGLNKAYSHMFPPSWQSVPV